MKLRLKLTLAIAFLFVVILLLGGMGSYYLRWLANDAHAIIEDNYRTLGYMEKLDQAMDLLLYAQATDSLSMQNPAVQEATALFRENIQLQLQNVTEHGEQQLSEQLLSDFEALVSQLGNTTVLHTETLQILEQIDRIYAVNQEAILRKNARANETADKVVLYMTVIGIASMSIGLIFVIGIPVYISRPIVKFNKAIQEITQGNYKTKLDIQSKDEFGQLAASFNYMAARLDEYEHSNLAKLLGEKKLIETIINQMSEAILGLDESKRIIFANDCALRLLGVSLEQVTNRYAPDVAVHNKLMNAMISELMINFEPWEEKEYPPLKIVNENKERLFAKNIVDVSARPTGENKEILIGHVIILSDITDFAKKDEAKTKFMASLSHELKTPVAAIEMSTNLMGNSKVGQLSEEQKKLIKTIDSNVARIKRTITEILDLSRIESGLIDIRTDHVSPKSVVDKAREGVLPFLEDKNLKIGIDINPDIPEILADPHKTVWVLNNFLTNAIRYSPEDSTITITAQPEDQYVKIAVTDKGKGIAAADQQRIFQKFTRISNNNSEGTGLGLAISKEFIEAMGGEIGLYSKEGEGSTFWVRLKKDI